MIIGYTIFAYFNGTPSYLPECIRDDDKISEKMGKDYLPASLNIRLTLILSGKVFSLFSDNHTNRGTPTI